MMIERLGIRGRLLLAFVAISGLAVLATAAAMYAFSEVGSAVEQITESRVPAAPFITEAVPPGRKVTATAPSILTATSKAQHEEIRAIVADNMAQLDESLASLKAASQGSSRVIEIEAAVVGLRSNFGALDGIVATRLAATAGSEELLRRLSTTVNASQRLITPAILVMNSKVDQWRTTIGDTSATRSRNPEDTGFLTRSLPMSRSKRRSGKLQT